MPRLTKYSSKAHIEKRRDNTIYGKRLRTCRRHLAAFEASERVEAEALVEDPRSLDDFLAHYVSHCFKLQTPEYIPRHAVLCVMDDHKEVRFSLPRTWASLKAWHGVLAWSPRTPITLELLDYCFLQAVNLGMQVRGLGGYLYMLAACLWRFAFFGLLRPAEFLGALVRDFHNLAHPAGTRVGLLAIGNPKTAEFFGRAQFSTVRFEPAVLWLAWAVEGCPAARKLWPSSALKLRHLFKAVVASAGLTSSRLNLSSFRPGGATNMFLENHPIETIQFAGRWKSALTLKAYIQEAMAHLVWNRLDEAQMSHIRAQREQFSHILARPPPLPCRDIFGDVHLFGPRGSHAPQGAGQRPS